MDSLLDRKLSPLQIHWKEYKARLKAEGRSYDEINKKLLDKLRHSNGDYQEIRNQIVEANLGIVLDLARKFWNDSLNLDVWDLVQEGIFGLIKAVEKYDFSKRAQFPTYATWWVRASIIRAIENTNREVRLPNHIHEALGKIKKAQKRLTQELGREPLVKEIAIELEMSPERIKFLISKSRDVLPLSAPIGEDSELQDLIQGSSDEEIMEKMFSSVRKGVLEKSLGELSNRERKVISLYYLMDGYTHKEIAKIFGVTGERIRQVRKGALEKLSKDKELLALVDEEIAV